MDFYFALPPGRSYENLTLPVHFSKKIYNWTNFHNFFPEAQNNPYMFLNMRHLYILKTKICENTFVIKMAYLTMQLQVFRNILYFFFNFELVQATI